MPLSSHRCHEAKRFPVSWPYEDCPIVFSAERLSRSSMTNTDPNSTSPVPPTTKPAPHVSPSYAPVMLLYRFDEHLTVTNTIQSPILWRRRVQIRWPSANCHFEPTQTRRDWATPRLLITSPEPDIESIGCPPWHEIPILLWQKRPCPSYGEATVAHCCHLSRKLTRTELRLSQRWAHIYCNVSNYTQKVFIIYLITW